MRVTRSTLFRITIAVIALLMQVLLRPILLPFAVGMTLAYLLAPVSTDWSGSGSIARSQL